MRIEWRYRRGDGTTWFAERLVFTDSRHYSVSARRHFQSRNEAIEFVAKKNLEIWHQDKRGQEQRCSSCRHFDRERMICRAGVSQLLTGQLKGSWVLYGSRDCERYEEVIE